MKHNFEDGFQLVFDMAQLKCVVDFLETGYGWQEKVSLKIIKHLKMQLSTIPKATVYCDNGEIKIAMLIFHQFHIAEQNKNVLNTPCLFAEKNYRGVHAHKGINATRLFEKLVPALGESILTSYTANPASRRILRKVGYVDMHVQKQFIGAKREFPFVAVKQGIKYLTIRRNSQVPIDITNYHEKYGDAPCLYKVIKIKKFGIRASVLNIYNVTSRSKFHVYWILKMLIRHRVVRINFYLMDGGDYSPDLWLIKNSESTFFISPGNSELSVLNDLLIKI